MRLYNRQLELIVYTTLTQTFTKLHVDFEVIASVDPKELNTAKITVIGLDEATRNLISDESLAVELRCGYGDARPKMIFRGTTTNIIHEKNGPNWYTTIFAGDGELEYSNKRVDKSYRKGTPVSKVFLDLAAALEIPFAFSVAPTDILISGQTYSGLVKDILNDLCKTYEYSWSILYGTLEIKDKYEPFTLDPIITILRPDTGLIGAPEMTHRTGEGTKKSIYGVKATALLNSDIRPGRLIEIDAPRASLGQLPDLMKKLIERSSVNGVYICDKIRYYGNNYGGEFYVEVEADLI